MVRVCQGRVVEPRPEGVGVAVGGIERLLGACDRAHDARHLRRLVRDIERDRELVREEVVFDRTPLLALLGRQLGGRGGRWRQLAGQQHQDR